MLHDLAVLTGGVVVTEDVGLELAKTKLPNLGTARKVLVGKDFTTILEGKASKPDVEARCAEIRTTMENVVPM